MARTDSGDYNWFTSQFQDVTSNTTMAVGTGDTVLVTGKTGHTIFVQRIIATITTDAAQSWSFEDTAGTPVVIAKIPSSPGVGLQTFDFGPSGVPLTVSTNLNLNVSAAGLAGTVHVEAYLKQTAVLSL
jgi:hypothetical protein